MKKASPSPLRVLENGKGKGRMREREREREREEGSPGEEKKGVWVFYSGVWF